MHKTITSDDLLLYVYNEASDHLSKEIEDHMKWDDNIREELLRFMKAKDGLSLLSKKPSKQSVDRIKSFNKAYKIVKTKSQQFEMIAN